MSKTLFVFCSSFFLATNILVADTIHFKNGAYIEVDKASEKDGQIEYWLGSTKYTIPSTKVEKIVLFPSCQPSDQTGTAVPNVIISLLSPSLLDSLPVVLPRIFVGTSTLHAS